MRWVKVIGTSQPISLLFTSSGPRWAVRFRTNILYCLIRHWYLVKWKCNTVHHEGMFAQERWTPQSLQCGMSPCSQKSPSLYVKQKCITANQEVKVTSTEHTNWILSLSWIPFQMVNLQRVANPLLYLVLTVICIYLTVEVCFKCKIYYVKKVIYVKENAIETGHLSLLRTWDEHKGDLKN